MNHIVLKKERNVATFILNILLEMRIKQWTKNLLVFASAIFSGAILNPTTLIDAFIGFLSFSFMASTIYIINDLVDVEKDRRHPDKRRRPIASGAINIPSAIVLAVFTFIIAAGLAIYVNNYVFLAVLVYFVMNLSYSLYLKHVVLIDVMIIAAGFVLRAVTGALAVDGVLTSWFILCTLGLSLFLALGKRRHELLLFKDDPANQRKVLNFYSVELFRSAYEYNNCCLDYVLFHVCCFRGTSNDVLDSFCTLRYIPLLLFNSYEECWWKAGRSFIE